jgi:hypothetical protein
VFELYNPNIDPVKCAKVVAEVGRTFNEAFLVVEGNNHGIATNSILKDIYPRSQLYKQKYATSASPAKYGWTNSISSKHALVGIMIEELSDLTIYGRQTVDGLNAFEETPEGRMEGQDDHQVISIGLALLGLKKFGHLKRRQPDAPPPEKKKPNYFRVTFEDIMDNLGKKRQRGINKQVGVGYNG